MLIIEINENGFKPCTKVVKKSHCMIYDQPLSSEKSAIVASWAGIKGMDR